MITLETLKDASTQEVFDQVATHLLTQMKKSQNNDGCFYRHDGLMCAAGCLISDSEYNSEMDIGDSSWSGLISRGLVTDQHHDFISELQFLHDEYEPSSWPEELKELSVKYNLEFKHEA